MKILTKIKEGLDWFSDTVLNQIGFDGGWTELALSIFNYKLFLAYSAKWTLAIGTAVAFLEKLFGLEWAFLLGFFLAIIMEVLTGVKASLKEGKKLQSNKWGRVFVKLGIYAALLFILNMFAKGEGIDLAGFEFNFFRWVYWLYFVGISIQLIISILENLSRMGYEETSLIGRLLKGRLKDWIDFERKTKKAVEAAADTPPEAPETGQDGTNEEK